MVFDHWKIDERLKSEGWKKHEIPFYKKGMADAIEGHWNDNIINYTHDFHHWYCKNYPDPKMKHGPVTYKEKAYVAGYEQTEEFIKLWLETDLEDLNTM